MHNRLVFATLGILGIVTAGCGGSGAPMEEVVPASGALTYQGKPLENFDVNFVPTDGRKAAVGRTDANGKFVLGTNEATDGAAPGKHKVSVVWAGPPPGDTANQDIIDDPAKLPKPPVQLPAKYASTEKSGIELEIPEDGSDDLKIDLQ